MFKNSVQQIDKILQSQGTNHQKVQTLVKAYITKPEDEKEEFAMAAFAALLTARQ